ncbi:hypothetical protein [Microbacterium sp. P05]|uniref:hypothetical protein n=1 Tax=Microbacterium sp. P05 TaxID=3366948 RepID=UPI003746CB8B
MSDEARYQGKPMLRVLDAYVLDALGALDELTVESYTAMRPKLAAALHAEAPSWQGVVERAMDMPPDSANALRAMWERHVHETLAAGDVPDVVTWVRQLVDARFISGAG